MEFLRQGVVDDIVQTDSRRSSDNGDAEVAVDIEALEAFAGDRPGRVVGFSRPDQRIARGWKLDLRCNRKCRTSGGLGKEQMRQRHLDVSEAIGGPPAPRTNRRCENR